VSYFAPAFSGLSSPNRFFTEQFITDHGSYIETCYPAGSSSPSSEHPGGAQAKLNIAAGPGAQVHADVSAPPFLSASSSSRAGRCRGSAAVSAGPDRTTAPVAGRRAICGGPTGWPRFFSLMPPPPAMALTCFRTPGKSRATGNWKWQADGLWHTIAQTVVMNTPGQADGSITVFYDGKQVARATGITFRATGDTDAIDSMIFTTFYGGNGLELGSLIRACDRLA